MPTTASATFSGVKLSPFYSPELARTIPVKLANGTYARGTVLGEVTATPGTFKAYASGNGDGSQVAKAILAFDCIVTAGVIVLTTTAGQAIGPQGEGLASVPAYYKGAFATVELTGFDANAMTNLGGHLVHGTVADGVVEIG